MVGLKRESINWFHRRSSLHQHNPPESMSSLLFVALHFRRLLALITVMHFTAHSTVVFAWQSFLIPSWDGVFEWLESNQLKWNDILIVDFYFCPDLSGNSFGPCTPPLPPVKSVTGFFVFGVAGWFRVREIPSRSFEILGMKSNYDGVCSELLSKLFLSASQTKWFSTQ